MPVKYELVDFTATNDEENQIVELVSTNEEPRFIRSILILFESLANGFFRWNVERERIGNHLTNVATLRNHLEYVVDEAIPVGHGFRVFFQNQLGGANGRVVFVVEYEIPET